MTKWQAILGALKGGALVGAVGTLLGLAVTIGLITADQGNQLAQLVSGLATLVTAIITAVHTFQAAKLLRRLAAVPKP